MSLNAVLKVALAVFKESVRDRVPFSMVLFSAVLMGAAYLMSQLTAGQDLKVIKDLGLATMNAMRYGLSKPRALSAAARSDASFTGLAKGAVA